MGSLARFRVLRGVNGLGFFGGFRVSGFRLGIHLNLQALRFGVCYVRDERTFMGGESQAPTVLLRAQGLMEGFRVRGLGFRI